MASATWWGQFQHDRQWHRHRPHHPHWENELPFQWNHHLIFDIPSYALPIPNHYKCYVDHCQIIQAWKYEPNFTIIAQIRLKILTKSTSNFVLVLVPKKNDDQHDYDHHDYDHHDYDHQDYHREQQVTMAAPNADKGNWVGVKTKESRRIVQHTITITKCKYEYKYNYKCKMIGRK